MANKVPVPENLEAAINDLFTKQVLKEAVEILSQDSVLDQYSEKEHSCGCGGTCDHCKSVQAEKENHYDDPGAGNYDWQKEDNVRSLMELTSFYDEAGPRSDPDGNYLCGTCKLRSGTGACLFVVGDISFTTGSCNIYINGTEPLGEEFALKEKLSPQDVGYAERPEAKGFGCKRCEYGGEAVAPDPDGRASWCREWGVHIRSSACCMRHDGPDMKLIQIGNAE